MKNNKQQTKQTSKQIVQVPKCMCICIMTVLPIRIEKTAAENALNPFYQRAQINQTKTFRTTPANKTG
ncbi:hypothetical protein M5D96_011033, partial [Drosophila gunungcola]